MEVLMKKSTVVSAGAAALGMLAWLLSSPAARSSGAHSSVLTWKDSNGKSVKIIAVLDSLSSFLIADPDGAAWRYDAIGKVTEPVIGNVAVYFASLDCTGPGYLTAEYLPRWTISHLLTPEVVEYRVLPDKIVAAPVTVSSFRYAGACNSQSAFQMQGIATTTTRVTTLPSALANTAFHPEFVEASD
jgi:hypothetical protein